jgi:hypothetical protein
VLSTLRWAETKLDEQQRATLTLTLAEDGISEKALRDLLAAAQVHVRTVSVVYLLSEHQKRFDCEVRWRSNKEASQNPAVLHELAHLPGLLKLAWKPVGTSPV